MANISGFATSSLGLLPEGTASLERPPRILFCPPQSTSDHDGQSASTPMEAHVSAPMLSRKGSPLGLCPGEILGSLDGFPGEPV